MWVRPDRADVVEDVEAVGDRLVRAREHEDEVHGPDCGTVRSRDRWGSIGYDGAVALRVRVCELDEVVEDELRAFPVAGVTWPVMMTRVGGELFAFPGVCPHDDVPLADYGVLAAGDVVCRVHGYRFDLHTGQCEHAPGLHLRRYRITLVGTEVWVDLL